MNTQVERLRKLASTTKYAATSREIEHAANLIQLLSEALTNLLEQHTHTKPHMPRLQAIEFARVVLAKVKQ